MNLLAEYDQLFAEEQGDRPVNEQYLAEKLDGTRNPNGSKKLKELKPVHEEMIAMHLEGFRNKDIALAFNVTDSTVSIVLSDPLAVAVIQQARKENEARFNNLYGKAIDVIEDSVMPHQGIDTRLKGAALYFKEAGNKGDGDKETAEDVIQKIINMQINGDIIINQGGG